MKDKIEMRFAMFPQAKPPGLYLVGLNPRTGAGARVYCDLFGDTPIHTAADEQIADLVKIKVRAARLKLQKGLDSRKD